MNNSLFDSFDSIRFDSIRFDFSVNFVFGMMEKNV
jgi:hypothetical protein